MYTQEVSIDLKSELDKDELIDEFGLLMSFYRSNGQTQGRIESQYIDSNRIVALPFTLEKCSLDPSWNNLYVNNQTEKIEKLCRSTLTIKAVGKSYDSYHEPCICKNPGFYILITDYVTIESPLKCGSCNKSVPLYRLPVYYDHGYMPILRWETNYISCDSLQMNCDVGEQWALEQMQETDSQLSIQGREICLKIESLTSFPTFYYLHNYSKFPGDDLTRPCPICDRKWALDPARQKRYDFKCDNCRIISTLSPNAR